jgi:putative transposase
MTDIKTKPFVKGYKYRIYPTDGQKELLNKTFGCCRYIWNKVLSDTKVEYLHYLASKNIETINPVPIPNITGYGLAGRLPLLRTNPESSFLSEVSYDVLQQEMLHLGSAFSTFLKKRKGYPAFKRKDNKQSFTLTKNVFRFKEGKLYIAKCKEPIDVLFSKELPSVPTTAVITKSPTGKYYISFTCEYIPVKTNGTGVIGIDLGLKDFIVTSNGIKVPNPKHLKKYEKLLKRRQQALSRATKGSKNRLKAKQKVALIHERISNCRNDFQHKLSRKLINENQVIGLELLKVKNMVRNRKLAKSISDAGWSSFVSKLAYKAKESQNTSLVFMDTWYPSTHICNTTKLKLDSKLKLSDRTWQCPHCLQVHDRDLNAAMNIRDEAILAIEINKVPLGSGISIIANNN